MTANHPNETDEVWSKFYSNQPATAQEIESVEQAFACTLPLEYKEFLSIRNGGYGFIGDSHAIFWKVGDLVQFNQEYCVNEFAPGLLLFGSDGCGDAFGFDTYSHAWPIIRVPFIDMSRSTLSCISSGFNEFIQAISTNREQTGR